MSSQKRHAFRIAVEAKDGEGIRSSFAPDVVLHTPVRPQAYVGRETAATVMAIYGGTLRELRYVDEFGTTDRHVLEFNAKFEHHEIEGVDVFALGADGAITDFMLAIGPFAPLTDLDQALRPRLKAAGLLND